MLYQYKKLLSFRIISLIILMLPLLAFSFSSEFETFFNISILDDSLIIDNKANISIPETNLSPLQRLYQQIKNYGRLELYLIDNKKKLIITPTNRLRLIHRSPVVVQLLNEPEKPDFIFSLKPITEDTNASTETKEEAKTVAAKSEEKQHYVPVANVFTQKILEHVVKYLEGSNAESQTRSLINILQQPQSLTELLLSFAYKKSIEVKCLISNKSNISSRSYLCGKLLAYDTAVYTLSSCYCIYNKLFVRKKKPAATSAQPKPEATATSK